jgi:hypothetical protein
MVSNAKLLLLSASFVLAAGCGGSPVQVDGYQLWSNSWNADAPMLKSRASFDLSCPRNDVTLKVLEASYSPHAFGRSTVGVARTVGAEGCGRRATYVRLSFNDQWVLNGASRAATEHAITAHR